MDYYGWALVLGVVWQGCTLVELRHLHTSVLFGQRKNVPVNCREEARGFHNLPYSENKKNKPTKCTN